MYIEVTKSMFRDEFKRAGRGDQFSYEGLGKLFDHCKDQEFDTGELMELDVILLCCDWVEMDDSGLISEYGEAAELYGDDATIDNLLEYLRDNTIIYELSNGNYLLQRF